MTTEYAQIINNKKIQIEVKKNVASEELTPVR